MTRRIRTRILICNFMEHLDIEKFDPDIAKIQKVIDEGRGITVSDFTNKEQLKMVKDQRLRLKELRVAITKHGKMLREEAVKFSKAVIGKEKELIALVEPEEERLAALEERAEKEKERLARLELLPKRKERLATIGDDLEVSDEQLIEMDGPAFEGYCNKRFADKNEKDRVALQAREAEVKVEQDKFQREKEIKEAEEHARKEERERAEKAETDLKVQREREDKERQERIEREEKERKDRAERVEREAKERAIIIEREAKERVERDERERKENVEAEAKAEADRKEKLAKDKKYLEFLSSHGHNAETHKNFHIEQVGNIVTLYKKVGEITL